MSASVEPPPRQSAAATSSSVDTAEPQATDASDEALERLGPLHAVPEEAVEKEGAGDEMQGDHESLDELEDNADYDCD